MFWMTDGAWECLEDVRESAQYERWMGSFVRERVKERESKGEQACRGERCVELGVTHPSTCPFVYSSIHPSDHSSLLDGGEVG